MGGAGVHESGRRGSRHGVQLRRRCGTWCNNVSGCGPRRTRIDRRRGGMRTAWPQWRAGCEDLGCVDDYRDRSGAGAA